MNFGYSLPLCSLHSIFMYNRWGFMTMRVCYLCVHIMYSHAVVVFDYLHRWQQWLWNSATWWTKYYFIHCSIRQNWTDFSISTNNRQYFSLLTSEQMNLIRWSYGWMKGKLLYLYRRGQNLRVPRGSYSQNFSTICTWRWQGFQPYAPASLHPHPPQITPGTHFC